MDVDFPEVVSERCDISRRLGVEGLGHELDIASIGETRGAIRAAFTAGPGVAKSGGYPRQSSTIPRVSPCCAPVREGTRRTPPEAYTIEEIGRLLAW